MIQLPTKELTNKMINTWNQANTSEYSKLDQRTKEYMKMYINQYMEKTEKNQGFVNKKTLAKIVSILKKINE